MQPDRPAASATAHKSLIMICLRARIVDGARIPIRNEVCPKVTVRKEIIRRMIGVSDSLGRDRVHSPEGVTAA